MRAARSSADRQVADEREALAVQAARGERQQQRARARMGDDGDARGMRRGDQRRARVGHRRQAGFARSGRCRVRRAPGRAGHRASAGAACASRALVRARQLDDRRAPAAAGPADRPHRRASGRRGSSSRSRPPSAPAARRRGSRRAAAARRARQAARRAEVERVRDQVQRARRGHRVEAPVTGATEAADRCPPGAAARRCGSAAGRSARSGRRTRSHRAGRCRGSRPWRCRRSRKAARCAGSARSRRRRVAKAHRHRRQLGRAKAAVDADHGDGRMEHDAAAAHRRSCATARAWSPGLPIAVAVEIGDLVGADDHGVAVEVGDRIGLGQRQAQRERRAAFRRAARLRRLRARARERQAQALQQFAPVARGRGEDEAPGRMRRLSHRRGAHRPRPTLDG